MRNEHCPHVVERQVSAFQLTAHPQAGIHQIVLVADDDGGGNPVAMLSGTRGPPARSAGRPQGDNPGCKICSLLHSNSFKIRDLCHVIYLPLTLRRLWMKVKRIVPIML